jgi:hypothetical protein
VVFGSCFMFSNFYRSYLYTETCVEFVKLWWSINEDWIENRTSLDLDIWLSKVHVCWLFKWILSVDSWVCNGEFVYNFSLRKIAIACSSADTLTGVTLLPKKSHCHHKSRTCASLITDLTFFTTVWESTHYYYVNTITLSQIIVRVDLTQCWGGALY